jgi:hypothetical protein
LLRGPSFFVVFVVFAVFAIIVIRPSARAPRQGS